MTRVAVLAFCEHIYREVTGPRCLIVDDEVLLAQATEFALEDEGFGVVGPIETLDEALEIARSEPIDVAVLDAAVEGESTIPVAHTLYERGVPFLFTACTAARAPMAALFPGVPFLVKPANEAELVATALRLLGGRGGPSGAPNQPSLSRKFEPASGKTAPPLHP